METRNYGFAFYAPGNARVPARGVARQGMGQRELLFLLSFGVRNAESEDSVLKPEVINHFTGVLVV